MKIVRIRSFSGPYFPAFELNTERYRISSYSVRKRENTNQKTPNTDTFHAVHDSTFQRGFHSLAAFCVFVTREK